MQKLYFNVLIASLIHGILLFFNQIGYRYSANIFQVLRKESSNFIIISSNRSETKNCKIFLFDLSLIIIDVLYLSVHKILCPYFSYPFGQCKWYTISLHIKSMTFIPTDNVKNEQVLWCIKSNNLKSDKRDA